MAALRALFFLYGERMSVGVGIVADSGDLPGDLHAGVATGDEKVVVG